MGLLGPPYNPSVSLEQILGGRVSPKFRLALNKVSDNGRAKTGGKSANAFRGNHLTETSHHTLVVDFRFELDTSLNHIDWAERAVRERAADTTGKGTLEVVCGVVDWCIGGRGGEGAYTQQPNNNKHPVDQVSRGATQQPRQLQNNNNKKEKTRVPSREKERE